MNNYSTFEEQLALHGELLYKSVGNSMEPFIVQGRDILLITRPEGRLKKYDVPLYRRPDGQYVLHRVHRVLRDGYVICGDNRISLEKNVKDEQVIGVLTKIIRCGREISLSGFKYRFYCFAICDLYFIRWLRFKFRAALRKIKELFTFGRKK